MFILGGFTVGYMDEQKSVWCVMCRVSSRLRVRVPRFLERGGGGGGVVVVLIRELSSYKY